MKQKDRAETAQETAAWENMPQGEELERAMAAAYRVYQDNVRETGSLIFDLTKGAREGRSEKELLEIALAALDKCRFGGDGD